MEDTIEDAIEDSFDIDDVEIEDSFDAIEHNQILENVGVDEDISDVVESKDIGRALHFGEMISDTNMSTPENEAIFIVKKNEQHISLKSRGGGNNNNLKSFERFVLSRCNIK